MASFEPDGGRPPVDKSFPDNIDPALAQFMVEGDGDEHIEPSPVLQHEPATFNSSQVTSKHGQDTRGRDSAPRYAIPRRRIVAVEVPMLVENVDRAVKAFDAIQNKSVLLDRSVHSVPFYLNPDTPWRQPVTSHGARTHNVLFEVTVPKRTGRRRKKGSKGSWEGEVEMTGTVQSAAETVFSRSRLDMPKLLRRKLEDNVGKYQARAVGVIDTTHRFRTLTDFQWHLDSSPFVQKFMSTVATNDVSKMQMFSLAPGTDLGPNVDIIPPPNFTSTNLPFNYAYSQNPYVQNVGNDETINVTAPNFHSSLISAHEPAPTGPKGELDTRLPRTFEILAELEEAFEERPIWTRRALLNRVGKTLPTWNEARKYISFVSYQFRSGPWRDAMVKYGVDPRTDPKYRIYQTLMFQLSRDRRTTKPPRRQDLWCDLERGRNSNVVPRDTPVGENNDNHDAENKDAHNTNDYGDDDYDEGDGIDANNQSHIFDGSRFCTDGKVWQVCDITDPLLAEMCATASVRPELSQLSGWFHGGLWAKVKAIMKTKLLAVMFGRPLRDDDFSNCLSTGDQTPPPGVMLLPLPNLRLTDEEWFALTGRRSNPRRRHRITAQPRRRGALMPRKTLEYFASGGGLPLRRDDGGQYDHNDDAAIDPSLSIAMDQDVNMDPNVAMDGDYDQIEEEIDLGYDDAEYDDEEEEEDEEDDGSLYRVSYQR